MKANQQHTLPPKVILNFLRWFCDPRLVEDVEGDLLELYQDRAETSVKSAQWLFLKDVLLLLRPGIIRNFDFYIPKNNTAMLLNHLKTAFRQAKKHKGYALINLSGLVVGVVSCLLILLWVNDELQMDRFHAKADRVYQVWRNMYQGDGSVSTTAGIPQPLENVLRDEYTEVEAVTAVSWENELLFRLDDKSTYERGRFASSGFFQVFSFPLIEGDPKTALDDIHSVLLSERLAQKLFGSNWQGNTIGKLIKIDERQEFAVTGVFENPGPNSSLSFDWILPAQEYMSRNSWIESWYNGGFRIYLSLNEGVALETVQERITNEINAHTNNEANELLYLQLFADNYLHATFENGRPVGGRIQYVRILTVIAIFILLIACINFMNMATARASTRAREIGVRKVMGAQRGTLGQQFFAESFLHATVSVSIAVLIVFLTLPFFNELTGKSLVLDFGNLQLWYAILAITVVSGLLSGSYPALLMPTFGITTSLKGIARQGKGAYFRKGLATFQFAIAIFLISGTFVVSSQLDYILSKDLGLDKENLVMIELEGDLANQYESYRTELTSLPEVEGVTFTSGNPLSYGSSTGGARWDGKNPDDVVEINVMTVGKNFVETMDMKVVTGSDFTDVFSSDSAHFLVNETLADIIGGDVVEKGLYVWGTQGMILGVLKDFHMDSMYEPIAPLIVRYDPRGADVAFVRIQGNTQQALQRIEDLTRKLNPAFPFRYDFLSEEYNNTYRSEVIVSTLVTIFAIVSVFISCLGLLGLSSFSADQRSKEIGVRKVLGAGTFKLVMLLSGYYAQLLLIAFVFAAPFSYFYMQNWLTNFTFHTDPGYLVFIGAGVLAFVLGVVTVSLKSYQAATSNPVSTLKED